MRQFFTRLTDAALRLWRSNTVKALLALAVTNTANKMLNAYLPEDATAEIVSFFLTIGEYGLTAAAAYFRTHASAPIFEWRKSAP